MRIATIVVSVLVGLILLFASVTYFLFMFGVIPPPSTDGMSDAVMKWNAGAEATVYLMPLVKVLELLCGIFFVTRSYVALANLVILPISVNAFLFHAFLAPETIAMAALLFIGNLFLIYAYRDRYKVLFTRK
ncbi:DoxX family protein [Flavobacterium selenitireducens]|uniref:DoxX family protein n=1 Tax=Flavobacterium selenitireducens TaxID=2722704 RepID=UPI00168BEEBC|nr:DoxX family protein [Flavobacterium selenitireducens]MBD3583165.1 DoxX family protein [Flavobacterium selenitireducens]